MFSGPPPPRRDEPEPLPKSVPVVPPSLPSSPAPASAPPPLPGVISADAVWVMRRNGFSSILGGALFTYLFIENGEGVPVLVLGVLPFLSGVLLLLRTRWSPEFMAAVFVGFVILGVIQESAIFAGIFAGALIVLYPRVRRAMHEINAQCDPR